MKASVGPKTVSLSMLVLSSGCMSALNTYFCSMKAAITKITTTIPTYVRRLRSSTRCPMRGIALVGFLLTHILACELPLSARKCPHESGA
jgi:hypothetical protein